jgi:hypothetical protein
MTAVGYRVSLDCHYRYVGNLGDPCSYCGVESSGWDHVPPLREIDGMRDAGVDFFIYDLRKIPCCRECNAMLGDTHLHNIRDRRRYILKRLMKRYAKFLRIPHWDESELVDASRQFKEDTLRCAKYAEWIRQRVSWARTNGVSFEPLARLYSARPVARPGIPPAYSTSTSAARKPARRSPKPNLTPRTFSSNPNRFGGPKWFGGKSEDTKKNWGAGQKFCSNCQASFATCYPNQIFCSSNCRIEYYNEDEGM